MSNIELLCSIRSKLSREQKFYLIQEILEKEGNYHKNLKVIHVAGTAGKGSTCNMISQVLVNRGYKVAQLISPHTIRINERISINSNEISNKDLNLYLDYFFSKYPGLSFRMYLTLVAIKYFYDNKVDYFVCEVFSGGRYDTTNIFENIACVLTSAGLDHINLFGNSIDNIIYEDMGIARPNVPFFTRIENKIIKEEANKIGAKLNIIKSKVNTNLIGTHQKENANLAYEVLKYIGLDDSFIRENLNKIKYKGRLQYIEKNIILDCAHNVIGFERLFSYIKRINFDKLYCCICNLKIK